MNTQANGKRSKFGFTLIELIVAVAVLSILITVGVPSFNTYIANQRVRTAALELMASFNYARSESIKRNTTDGVYVMSNTNNANWGNGWFVTTDNSVNCASDPSNSACLQLQTAREDVTVTKTDSGLNTITYERSGRVSGANIPRFEVCDSNASAQIDKRIVEIDLSGRAKISIDGKCS